MDVEFPTQIMAKPQPKWSVVEKARNIHEFRLNGSLKTGSEAWILWMADEHFDHPKCNLDLLKQHHNEAVDRGALIVKAGDTFCAMQGKGDPRGDKGSVRDEHWGGNYLDLLVSTAAEWYAPYRNNIAIIGLGNHETSVYKHHETCLIERLCQSLRDKGGITRKGGYSGWVRLMLTGHGTKTYSYRTSDEGVDRLQPDGRVRRSGCVYQRPRSLEELHAGSAHAAERRQCSAQQDAALRPLRNVQGRIRGRARWLSCREGARPASAWRLVAAVFCKKQFAGN
jgi:hypothetical protein